MKKITFLLVFISIFGYAQTPITDANFQTAINTCLATNPVDGMCSDSEYGAMPEWDVSNVTNMSSAFQVLKGENDPGFNGNLSAWDVSNVTNMEDMFSYAASFNGDLSVWDVSKVTHMDRMFPGTTSFNGNLSEWDVSKVTNMNDMFENSGLSTENYDKLLLGWSELTLQQGVIFESEGINFCNGAAARQSIIDTYGWIITDAGLDCATASIDDQNQLNISIYPNPTNDKLFIQGLSDATEVSIYNILGKEVISTKNTSNINVQALPSGVYVIRISDGLYQTNRKFIKN